MTALKKERTPEQIEAARARMAAVRAKKGTKPRAVLEATGGAKAFVEHKKSAAIPNEFEGISAKDCCDSCYASKGQRCAITHDAICGHPLKGGIQSRDMMKADVVDRFQKAKKILAHAKIEAG